MVIIRRYVVGAQAPLVAKLLRALRPGARRSWYAFLGFLFSFGELDFSDE